ncbi:MAG: hypothetical protein DRZ90_12775 [Spirochaetes bacterium]|nr:MAG: hypothetical protein DRZ90_12775 [Spirochaetota bacterium]
MFDSYEWNTIEGKGNAENLTLLSLSTCGFCRSARQYLKDREVAFRYLELDTLPPEEKTELKGEFKPNSAGALLFPPW